MKKKGTGRERTAKGGDKNISGGAVEIISKSKSKESKTINENVRTINDAVFNENGSDRNVTENIAPSFMKFERNGIDISIEFSTKLSLNEVDLAFSLVKKNMEKVYNKSGYMWDDDDKFRALNEKGARFLLIRKRPIKNDQKGELLGFVHFRFAIREFIGEVLDAVAGNTCLFVYDIHLEDHLKKKGLGRHLLVVLELIARQQKMSCISLPIHNGDNASLGWLTQLKIKGFEVDTTMCRFNFDSEMEGFQVYSKEFKEISKSNTQPLIQIEQNACINKQNKVKNDDKGSKIPTKTMNNIEIAVQKISSDIDLSATLIVNENEKHTKNAVTICEKKEMESNTNEKHLNEKIIFISITEKTSSEHLVFEKLAEQEEILSKLSTSFEKMKKLSAANFLSSTDVVDNTSVTSFRVTHDKIEFEKDTSELHYEKNELEIVATEFENNKAESDDDENELFENDDTDFEIVTTEAMIVVANNDKNVFSKLTVSSSTNEESRDYDLCD